jgi:Domain of unknown function (DUF4281)
MERLFSISNLLALPFWLLMIAFPHWRWTRRLLRSPLIAVPPVIVYAAVVLPRAQEILTAVVNPALSQISRLLGTPAGATAAWAHFLAFDLFVGRWAYLDSRERNISAWIMAPVLFLILMLGPLGFVLYLGVRVLVMRSLGDNRAAALAREQV